jgi:hypothetical protein
VAACHALLSPLCSTLDYLPEVNEMFGWWRRRRDRTRSGQANKDIPPGSNERIFKAQRLKRLRKPPWQVKLEQEIFRLSSSLSDARSRLGGYEDSSPYAVSLRRIEFALNAAREYLLEFGNQSWVRRRILAGGVYEAVFSYLQTASEDLLLVDDEQAILARVPAIRAAVKAYMKTSDPRFDAYMQVIDSLTQAARSESINSDSPRPPRSDPPSSLRSRNA